MLYEVITVVYTAGILTVIFGIREEPSHLGDVIVEGERLYGDGVNIAARLESLAIPGGICISGTVYDRNNFV